MSFPLQLEHIFIQNKNISTSFIVIWPFHDVSVPVWFQLLYLVYLLETIYFQPRVLQKKKVCIQLYKVEKQKNNLFFVVIE